MKSVLLTYEQCKYLKAVGDEHFKFIGHDKASNKEKKELLKLDDFLFDVYGYHVIINYIDLKK